MSGFRAQGVARAVYGGFDLCLCRILGVCRCRALGLAFKVALWVAIQASLRSLSASSSGFDLDVIRSESALTNSFSNWSGACNLCSHTRDSQAWGQVGLKLEVIVRDQPNELLPEANALAVKLAFRRLVAAISQ